MKRVVLVLCHLDDRSAIRVYCALRARLGPAAIALVSSEELVFAARWNHLLEAGTVLTELTLADGRRFSADSLGLVFQRIQRVEMPQFERSSWGDRSYAASEMHALLMSWLAGLPCPVVNRAGPRGLCGAERSPLEWMALAARAGFPTRGFELVTEGRRFHRTGLAPHLATVPAMGSDDPPPLLRPQLLGRSPVQYLEPLEGLQHRVLVVGRQCYGTVPGVHLDACLNLARLTGDHLLEIGLGRVGSEWRFCSASPLPEISPEAAGSVADSLANMSVVP